MGVQGILQGLRRAGSPLLLSALRLVVFVFPLVGFFALTAYPRTLVWLAFPIAELLTMFFALLFLKRATKAFMATPNA